MAYSLFFSKIYDFIFFPVLNPIRKKIAREVSAIKPQNLIDMCCGTGNQIKYFKNLPNTKIAGIDISENMLTIAKKHVQENICSKQDATQTNFDDNHFDIAILNFILHETSPEIAYKISSEAKRIVKQNGKIIITDYIIDKKTLAFGAMGVSFVEFLIGGEHYRNFKKYIADNLFNKYISDLELTAEHKFVLGAVRIKIFNNHKNR